MKSMLRIATLSVVVMSLLASSSAPVKSKILVPPQYRCPALALHPHSATLKLHEDVVFDAVTGIRGFGSCTHGPGYGSHWTASGGKLIVYRGMAQAEFLATRLGTYTVTATLYSASAVATIQVRR